MKNHVVVNVNCEAAKASWTEGATVKMTLSGRILTRVMVVFPPGLESVVYIRVLKAGAPLIPDTMVAIVDPEGDYGITGGEDLSFPLECELKRSQELLVQYRNLDEVDVHEIMVDFQFDDLPTPNSQLRS